MSSKNGQIIEAEVGVEATSVDRLAEICASLGKQLRACFGELPVGSEDNRTMIAEVAAKCVDMMLDAVQNLSISDAYKVIDVTLEDFFKRYLRFKSPASAALISSCMSALLVERLLGASRAKKRGAADLHPSIVVGVTIGDLRTRFKVITRQSE